MKHLTLTLFLILGLTSAAQANNNWFCNEERGTQYEFLLSFSTTSYEVTRKGKTWPVSQQGIYIIWHEEKRTVGGDVSASINVFDPSTALLHYKALHFENDAYLGESGAAMKCRYIQ